MLKKYLIPLFASVLFLSACGGAVEPGISSETPEATDANEPLKIVTTFPPLYSFATNVAGDLAQVTNLVEPGASVHTWEPTASDLRALAQADLLIMNGLNLELFIEDMIDSAQNEDLKVLVISDFLEDQVIEVGEMLELDHNEAKQEGHSDEDHEDHEGEEEHSHEEDHDHDDEHDHEHDEEDHDHDDDHNDDHSHEHDEEDHDHGEEHHDHAHEGPDPHLWLNPELAMIQVGAIREALVELDPENKETYQANTRAYLQKLNALDAEIFEQFTASSRSPENFIVFHNAYDYFFNRYSTLSPYLKGAVEPFPGREPTAAYFQELIELIEQEKVKIIFTEPQFNPTVAQRIQEETGIQSFEVDPIGLELSPEAYENNMRALSDAFSEAFYAIEPTAEELESAAQVPESPGSEDDPDIL